MRTRGVMNANSDWQTKKEERKKCFWNMHSHQNLFFSLFLRTGIKKFGVFFMQYLEGRI